MVTLVITYLLAVLILGVLVTVHVFGCAWVAHRLGVKVLRVSIGFGPTLWLRHYGKDKTEFAMAAIPTGGYVKMLDEREGEVATEELPRVFNRQSLKVRTAIVIAGPLFNFLFAILVYTMIYYMIGITGMKALIGEVTPHSLADQAGFRAGSQIFAVNGEPTASWDSVIQATVENLVHDKKQLTFSVLPPLNSPRKQGEEVRNYQNLSLNLQSITIDEVAKKDFLGKVGMYPLCPPPSALISEILPGSPAQTDGQGRGTQNCFITNDQLITEQYGFWRALREGLAQTGEMSLLTLRILGNLLTLQVSPKNISIAKYVGKSTQGGIVTFLTFLGFVSVSLAVLHLLPIPSLSGGYLLFYLIEFIKGKPQTERTEFGLRLVLFLLTVFLFSLLGLAVFNDLGGLFSG